MIRDYHTYKENRVRNWWATQRVFYDMLQDLGVWRAKSKIMYLGVLLGCSKWIELVPGDSCGKNCINDLAEASGAVRIVEDRVYREWDETYDTAEYDEAMKCGVAELELNGDQMTLGDVNALAAYLMPDQPVFSHGARYRPSGAQDAIIGK